MKALLTGILLGVGMAAWCSAGEKSIAVINAAGLPAPLVESIRAHAERELYVPVTARTADVLTGDDLKGIGKSAAKLKTADDVCLIVLAAAATNATLHATTLTNEQVAVINVTALKSADDVANTRRLQRWALRGAAFLLDLKPDPDPHCVMHDYVTLADLDKLGLNFSPPWGDQFRKAAAARGLTVRPLFTPRPGVRR